MTGKGETNRLRRKLVLELFIEAKLIKPYSSGYIQTGHFTQNRSFFLYIQKKVNITCDSWIFSYPYLLYNFYQEFFNTNISLSYFVFFVISRYVKAYFDNSGFWKDLK